MDEQEALKRLRRLAWAEIEPGPITREAGPSAVAALTMGASIVQREIRVIFAELEGVEPHEVLPS